MKHISKTKNKKIIKRRRHRTQARAREHTQTQSQTQSQSGGVKVVIGMDAAAAAAATPGERPIEREVLTLEHFKQILDTARNLEVISSSSLNSFVVKIHLADDHDFFKSDMVGDNGKKLDFIEIMDATSGRAITEVIIKICIIGRSSHPRDYVFNQTTTDKRAVDNAEFLNEY